MYVCDPKRGSMRRLWLSCPRSNPLLPLDAHHHDDGGFIWWTVRWLWRLLDNRHTHTQRTTWRQKEEEGWEEEEEDGPTLWSPIKINCMVNYWRECEREWKQARVRYNLYYIISSKWSSFYLSHTHKYPSGLLGLGGKSWWWLLEDHHHHWTQYIRSYY